jgi:hypothetical protein
LGVRSRFRKYSLNRRLVSEHIYEDSTVQSSEISWRTPSVTLNTVISQSNGFQLYLAAVVLQIKFLIAVRANYEKIFQHEGHSVWDGEDDSGLLRVTYTNYVSLNMVGSFYLSVRIFYLRNYTAYRISKK